MSSPKSLFSGFYCGIAWSQNSYIRLLFFHLTQWHKLTYCQTHLWVHHLEPVLCIWSLFKVTIKLKGMWKLKVPPAPAKKIKFSNNLSIFYFNCFVLITKCARICETSFLFTHHIFSLFNFLRTQTDGLFTSITAGCVTFCCPSFIPQHTF